MKTDHPFLKVCFVYRFQWHTSQEFLDTTFLKSGILLKKFVLDPPLWVGHECIIFRTEVRPEKYVKIHEVVCQHFWHFLGPRECRARAASLDTDYGRTTNYIESVWPVILRKRSGFPLHFWNNCTPEAKLPTLNKW